MDIKLEKMYGLFINGEFVPAQSGRTFKTCNPATGEVLAQIAMASADDVDCAVKAAWAAFSSWKKTTAKEYHDQCLPCQGGLFSGNGVC